MAHLRKRGSKWYVYWREFGREQGRAISTRKKDAEDFKAEIEIRIKREGILGISPEKRVRFDLFCDIYKRTHGATQSQNTRDRDDITIRVHLKPYFGKRLLQNIGQEDVEKYRSKRLADVKTSTVNRELDSIKSIFNRAVEWNYLKESPARKVQKQKPPMRPPTWFTLDQCYALVDTADGQTKTFCALGVFAGLRKGEIFGLWWSDVDLKRGELTIFPGRSKGDEFRMIPIDDTLREILEKQPRHIRSKHVIHNPDGSPRRDIRKAFTAALDAAKLPTIRIHDMRHSFASNLIAAGEDLRTVMELMGHRNLSTLQRYAHLAPGKNRSAIEKLRRPGSTLVAGR